MQLVGTLFFNVTTFRALSTAVDSPSYDRLVWRPDALGSICFLVSGYLAYVEVTGGLLRRPPRTVEGGIVAVNLLGCLAFGLSALAAYVVPATGTEANVAVANAATSAGALAFLVGALLLLPEGARRRDRRGLGAVQRPPSPSEDLRLLGGELLLGEHTLCLSSPRVLSCCRVSPPGWLPAGSAPREERPAAGTPAVAGRRSARPCRRTWRPDGAARAR